MTVGEFMIFLYSVMIVICLGVIVWFKTESGKRWLTGEDVVSDVA